MEISQEAMRIAKGYAYKFCRSKGIRFHDYEDAQQEAMLGATIACRVFDPEREGANLKGLVLKSVFRRLVVWYHRLPIVHRADRDYTPAPLQESFDSPNVLRKLAVAASPELGVFNAELLASLHRLPPHYREVLVRRYGLESDAETLEEIASHEKISKQAVSERHARAVKKLKNILSLEGVE